ncbi:MAG: glycosyltransferase family 4 protein [Saprospiraceae bacterium]|nr:glycosyltransferase family 4 protein [Saprospiraceae bacterium]
MKKIVYLTYHYPPDLSAGSFRNHALSLALSDMVDGHAEIHLFCTQPNRYSNFKETALEFEQKDNLHIYRLHVSQHGNRFWGQIRSFYEFERQVKVLVKKINPDFIFASSSKLFTAYLAYKLSQRGQIKYYIDLRDLFAENLKEFIRIPLLNELLSFTVRHFFEKPCLMNASHININSGGFQSNIPKGFKGSTSFYPNGIDDAFLNWKKDSVNTEGKKLICYAGNIGEAQGLHHIVPALAKKLEGRFTFLLIGDGSAKNKLQTALDEFQVSNVEWHLPVNRDALLHYYLKSDYLFLHLNDFKSLEKVLPSKLFEYASGNLPILAGVKGYAKEFIEKEIKSNYFIFNPGDVDAVVNYLENDKYQLLSRPDFIEKYKRNHITLDMATSILQSMRN